jgi:methylated-DNA-[protein]-cysteine S-methyltransferase
LDTDDAPVVRLLESGMTYSEAFTVVTDIVHLAVTMHGGAVTRIRLGCRGSRSPASAAERHVARELEEYAQGQRRTFSFAISPDGSAFDHGVWKHVAAIPYGATRTYGEIARALGRPGAARAVGAANGRNPVPLVIPCHRVVAAGGGLGGYGGGLDLKRRLLSLEQRRRPLTTVVRACVVLLASTGIAAACGTPERPTFPWNTAGPDTTAPRIEFLTPPPADSVFDTGDRISVTVRITDRSPIISVATGVLGVMTFGFDTLFPDDTIFEVTYPIATPLGVTGRIELRVVATDTARNRASVGRGFVLQ